MQVVVTSPPESLFNILSQVMGGYRFLMQNYLSGDRICLFGFSRGAYTARALAGMLFKVIIAHPVCSVHP
jgi:uncharacterized protein (DUF2235 family)